MDTYRNYLSDADRESCRLDELKVCLETALELAELLTINVPVKKALKTVNERLAQIERDNAPTIFYKRYQV